MKKALMVATVPSMIGQFNKKNLLLLKEIGYEVEIACDFKNTSAWNKNKIQTFCDEMVSLNIKTHQIDFSRSPLNLRKHARAYSQLNKLKKNNYELVHCHTPIASALTRLTFKKENLKMIYTAHGFHFYKGAPILNWIIYYPIERILARYTDELITINQEDFGRAKKFKLKKNGEVVYIPGIGIDLDKISEKKEKRKELINELKLKESERPVLLLSVGELNDNKNHVVVIKALKGLQKNFHYLICGIGDSNKLIDFAKEIHVEDRLHLLGYRDDVVELMKSCDYFIFPSKREGLSVALLEAMASGITCIASNIRGNNDLIINNKNGYLITIKNASVEIPEILSDKSIRQKDFADFNRDYIKKFSSFNIEQLLKKIYENKER